MDVGVTVVLVYPGWCREAGVPGCAGRQGSPPRVHLHPSPAAGVTSSARPVCPVAGEDSLGSDRAPKPG